MTNKKTKKNTKIAKVLNTFSNGFKMQNKKQFAEKFIAKRAVVEVFTPSDHSFGYVDNLEVEFLKTVYTGYITDKFYSTAAESLQAALPVHQEMYKKKPAFYKAVIKRARNEAAIKDQLILGAYIAGDAQMVRSMAPAQIDKLLKWGYKGQRTKKLIKAYMKNLEKDNKLSFYMAKNIKHMRTLVNSAHALIPKESYHFLMHPKTQKLTDTLLLDVSTVMREHSMKNMKGDVIPFEVARTHIPKVKWKEEGLLEKCDINPYAMLSQASELSKVFGEKEIASRLSKAKYITSDKFLTAAFAIGDEYPLLTKTLANLYIESVKQTYKKLTLPFELNHLIVVIDISGSMSGYIQKLLATIAPFAPVIDQLIYFGDSAAHENPKDLMTFEGLKRLNYTGGATNIAAGLKKAAKYADGKSTVVIMTDEQGNIGSDELSWIKKIKHEGAEVMVVNPTDYSAHALLSDAIYVPAPTPEAFASAVRYTQLRHVTQADLDNFAKGEETYGETEETDE